MRSGGRESRVWIENELSHFYQSVHSDVGKLSLSGISLSQEISCETERRLRLSAVSGSGLPEHPELLGSILSAQMGALVSSMKEAGATGVLVILNGTVNPSLENAESSRAGIYLKSTEPNIASSVDTNVRFLRGPADIARAYGIELMPQWKMEFDTDKLPCFASVMDTAAEHPGVPLSRLFYWTGRTAVDGDTAPAMLLCVPLIGGDASVFGICGFETSSMSFKNSYSPDNSVYPHVFSVLAPVSGDTLDISRGIVAGSFYQTNSPPASLSIDGEGAEGILSFLGRDGRVYEGLGRSISPYPGVSEFSDGKWMLAVIMPADDPSAASGSANRTLFLSMAVLLVFSLLAAVFISRRYISPVIMALDAVKSEDRSRMQKTNVLEIDDLFQYWFALDEKEEKPAAAESAVPAAQPGFSYFDALVKNIGTLSPAEKAVFDLYMEGHTANEIADILCLSINTIKTHNRRIFMKLNVSSRKELMVYVRMMREMKSAACPE